MTGTETNPHACLSFVGLFFGSGGGGTQEKKQNAQLTVTQAVNTAATVENTQVQALAKHGIKQGASVGKVASNLGKANAALTLALTAAEVKGDVKNGVPLDDAIVKRSVSNGAAVGGGAVVAGAVCIALEPCGVAAAIVGGIASIGIGVSGAGDHLGDLAVKGYHGYGKAMEEVYKNNPNAPPLYSCPLINRNREKIRV